ncbi:MAG TPA: helix-turn-helix domain-containing protein [Hyphomicrobiaceae bacterium]|nr:helix-turn-helix domain-containing protein [Hyphomicrobiaceae bacterium]
MTAIVLNQAFAAPPSIAGFDPGRARHTAGRGQESGAIEQAGLVHLSNREDLFLEGDEASHVYEVMSGVVCLYRIMPDGGRHILAFRFPGDIVGLCSPANYGYNAQAVGDARVRRISRAGLERMIDERADFARKLLRMAAAELNAMRDHLTCLASKSAEAKVADFLLMLIERSTARAGADVVVDLPMTRTDIGDYLGLTIETVSRTISKMRRSGIIDLPRTTRVVVRSEERLAELAGAA